MTFVTSSSSSSCHSHLRFLQMMMVMKKTRTTGTRESANSSRLSLVREVDFFTDNVGADRREEEKKNYTHPSSDRPSNAVRCVANSSLYFFFFLLLLLRLVKSVVCTSDSIGKTRTKENVTSFFFLLCARRRLVPSPEAGNVHGNDDNDKEGRRDRQREQDEDE